MFDFLFWFITIGFLLFTFNVIVVTTYISTLENFWLFNEKYYFFPSVIYKNSQLNKLGSLFLGIFLFIENYLYNIIILMYFICSKDFINYKDYIVFVYINVELYNHNIINCFTRKCIENNFLILKTNQYDDKRYVFKIKVYNLILFYKIIDNLLKNNKYNDIIVIKKIRKENYFDIYNR